LVPMRNDARCPHCGEVACNYEDAIWPLLNIDYYKARHIPPKLEFLCDNPDCDGPEEFDVRLCAIVAPEDQVEIVYRVAFFYGDGSTWSPNESWGDLKSANDFANTLVSSSAAKVSRTSIFQDIRARRVVAMKPNEIEIKTPVVLKDGRVGVVGRIIWDEVEVRVVGCEPVTVRADDLDFSPYRMCLIEKGANTV